MRIRFITEARLSTISANGPGAVVYEAGSVHDLDEIAARIFLNSGLAVTEGQKAVAEPTNAELKARLVGLGIEVPKNAIKAQLKALLEAAESEGSDEDAAGDEANEGSEPGDGSEDDDATGDEDAAGDD